ncbi:MAG: [FeFe] hydrogenase H-cluster radical SAM maturase HydG [Elusimicrobiota bacterium]|jgi:2-iminoacetate synthase
MNVIEQAHIESELAAAPQSGPARIREVLARARELKGLSMPDVVALMGVQDPILLQECFATARWIKGEIYGNRIVYFAPLYVSNLCCNDCAYCAFRTSNLEVRRKALNQDEVRAEAEALIRQGHKRILLVSGEAYPKDGLKYIFDCIRTVYSVHLPQGNIRRVNVNIAPLSVEEFRELEAEGIGTYQEFQETFHAPTYRSLHRRGPKSDYDYRLGAMARALTAGIKDVGVGVLFGLYDWRYEVLALLAHIRGLEAEFGIGPHTISVPRIEPALGAPLSSQPPYAVSDRDFMKIIAILRMAVPYTGMILSTREGVAMRRAALELGISQISAGSRTDPGGYSEHESGSAAQFSLGDTRPLDQVVADVLEMGHIPSFCTGCYRLGRTGKDFMDLAKPGLIKQHCLPNALLTFAEYLCDFAGPEFSRKGFAVIDRMLAEDVPGEGLRLRVRGLLDRVRQGERDLYL